MVEVRFQLNMYTSREEILNAVAFLVEPRGRTNTAQAIRVANNQMFTTSNGDR